MHVTAECIGPYLAVNNFEAPRTSFVTKNPLKLSGGVVSGRKNELK